MSAAPQSPVDLVFLWHHHQPDYRSPGDGRSVLPWVRLHATKDYLDMARRLERHPRLRATFNFVPSLLDQIEDARAGRRDRLFDLLERPVANLLPEERVEVMRRCGMVPPYTRERWPDCAGLLTRASRALREAEPAARFADRDLAALESWFLVAWADPMFHDDPAVVASLEARPPGESHRDALLELHARLLAQVLPAYRAGAASGQLELSSSPYYHPIIPLLAEPQALRRARPDLRVPAQAAPVPEDAARQIGRAIERHAAIFGAAPGGMWPPEGSVSPEAAGLYARAGVRWIASDEAVLWQSLPPATARARRLLYQPWRLATDAGEITLFFRDRELSDRIGFVYHHWTPEEAAADFVARVRRIGEEHGREGPVTVSVILDGENCWENYVDDGGPFLDALYRRLDEAKDIVTRTPSEILAGRTPAASLAQLHSGSWIDADFHIWMGHPEKNRAWDALHRTRRTLVDAGTPADLPDAWEHLDAAEGSDWFWWFGEDHYTADKVLFDRLFREHLQAVHESIGSAVPMGLQAPIARGADVRDPASRPIGIVRPVLDGEPTQFYEWHAAGRFRCGAGGGSMHRGPSRARMLYFGFDLEQLYLRLDFADPPASRESLGLRLEVAAEPGAAVRVRSLARGRHPLELEPGGAAITGAVCASGAVVELGLPFAALGLVPGSEVELGVQLLEDGESIEPLPDGEVIRFVVPDARWESSMWSV